MSYLDQLKKQVKEVEDKEKEAGKSETQLTAKYEQSVKPTLKKIYFYFNEMSKQLNVIKPDLPITFNLKGMNDYTLQQDEYIIGKLDAQADNFFFRMVSHSRKKPRISITEQSMVTKYKKYLDKYNLPFKVGLLNNNRHQFVRAVFELQGVAYTELTFRAEYKSSTIYIVTRNLRDLGHLLTHNFKNCLKSIC
jgi:hypothetical protein